MLLFDFATFTSTLPQILQDNLIVLFTTPLYFVIILTEIIASRITHKQYYSLADTLSNIYLTVCNMLIDVLVRGGALFIYAFFYSYKLFTIDNVYLYWATLLIAEDFFFYWLHYTDHYVRLFWAMHVTHHSSTYFNFTIGFRSTVFEPLYRFLFFFPLALMGFKGIDIILMYAITQIWGILVHTNFVGKLGPIEWIFTTPSHHRVHHGSNTLYLDKNMGMFLIIWDKMFGTFQKELSPEEYEPIRFGLTTNINTYHPVKMVFHEWIHIYKDVKKVTSWKHKLMYIFGPPGWSHDGSTLTSEQLRKKITISIEK